MASDKKPAQRPDWPKIAHEYIHGTETLRAIAQRYGVGASSVMRRSATEGWEAARSKAAAEISKLASEQTTLDRSKELADFNSGDIKVAKALRVKAEKMLMTEDSPQGVRALAGALESAQRIARLALGASTENQAVTGKDGAPIAVMTASPDEYRAVAEEVAARV